MAGKRKAEKDVAGPRKRVKQPQPRTTPNPREQASPLLNLAAELRNRIYQYTLVSASPLASTTDEPGLLTTCRQIRSEALGIYYSQNTFEIRIRDCDARAFVRFQQHLVRLGVQAETKVVTVLSGTPNRENLVWWAKQVWVGRSVGIEKFEGKEASTRVEETYRIVCTALDMCMRMRRVGWDVVEIALEALLNAVEQFEERWEAR